MTDKPNQNGWNEYSRLVLAELEKLNNKVDDITADINGIKQEMSKFEQVKYDIKDLKSWKNNSKGSISLNHPNGWTVEPAKIDFELSQKGKTTR